MSNLYKSRSFFWLYKSKSSNLGLVPIYLRIISGRTKTELATGIFINLKDWDAKTGRIKERVSDSELNNAKLDAIYKKYILATKALVENGEELTAAKIKCQITAADNSSVQLIDIIKIHNERAERLKGKDYTPATVERYNTVLTIVKQFLKEKYGVTNYPLNRLGIKFLNDFLEFLKIKRENAHNTAVKYCINLKTIINFARVNGYIEKNPFEGYRFSLKKVDTVFLTDIELAKIEKKQLEIERLESIRRIFLFQCYTGLAYADIKKLKKSEIITMLNKEWINTFRTKSKIPVRVPLLKKAEKLLAYGANDEYVFNVPSNQKMNAYLKELADLCGIKKNLCTHTARRTFATTITLSQGVSISSVSEMLGHTNLRTTQIYAKVIPEKLLKEMQKLE